MSARNSEGGAARSNKNGSIAWAITGSFWWRKVLGWLFFDIALVIGAGALIAYGYYCSLPAGFEVKGFVLAPPTASGNSIFSFFGNVFSNVAGLRLSFTSTAGKTVAHALGQDLLRLWPVFLVVLLLQLIDFFGIFGDLRRVRKRLKPLNDLAVRADALGSASAQDAASIDTLEQAIERASVEAPEVNTGVSDLASVEVALNNLLRQMQEAKLQQMRFVSDASHELRTPIAVIQGYVNMLDRWGKDDPAVLEESIEALKSESQQMQELVEQLLFLARGDAGRTTLNKSTFNLAGLAETVCDESAMIDAGHRYELAFDPALSSDDAYNVCADAGLVKQAVRALVQNAAKYSAQNTAIKLGVSAEGDKLGLSVQDEGEGMCAEDVQHIFDRFWRSESARGSNKGGSGLGLSIAKWIADAHGGQIEVVSHEGVGTRFTVLLPRGV